MPAAAHRTNRKPSKRLLQILTENMRCRRRHCGLSQEELADMCRLHRTYVSSVARGQRNITIGTLEAIAKALCAKPDELLRK